MLPEKRFTGQGRHFWANVRTISEAGGYTKRANGRPGATTPGAQTGARVGGTIRVFTVQEMRDIMVKVGLRDVHLFTKDGPTQLARDLQDYFQHRADVLNNIVQHQLMDLARAEAAYEKLRVQNKTITSAPRNKQTGEKATTAFLAAIVNLLVEANRDGVPCEIDPQYLTTFTRNDVPLRTLARRVDGCLPNHVNPIGLWEVKEYYHTTTFGSRVADGVYETLLDGLELEELRQNESIDVQHLLIVDAHYTWWVCGRSYLCRMIDMLHMGNVDEILFGEEVVTRLPEILKDWVRRYREAGRG
jgi:hypothetical protein